MNRRLSSSARPSNCCHSPGSSCAAASTGAETASRSAAKKAISSNGKGKAATARAAAARNGIFDRAAIGAEHLERLGDQRIARLAAGARDQVDQLTPAHRPFVRVARRLVQHGHQAVVEAQFGLSFLAVQGSSLYRTLAGA